MSMRELGGIECDMQESGSEDWLEEEIQKQLSQLDSDDVQDGELADPGENFDQDSQNHAEEDDPIPSMEQYISWIQKQTQDLESELQECDEVLQEADIVSSRQPQHPDEGYLVELAKEEGVDVHTLKQKILEDINHQDEEDERRMLQAADDADISMVTQDVHSVSMATDKISDIPSVTNENLQNGSVHEENLEAGSSGLNHISGSEDSGASSSVNNDMSLVLVPKDSGDNSEAGDNKETVSTGLLQQPGGGVVAEITESDVLEKQLWQHIKSMEDKHKHRQDVRKQERDHLCDVENKKMAATDVERKQRQELIRSEQEQLLIQQQENERKLIEEVEELRKDMDSSLKVYERELAERSALAEQEKEQFRAAKEQLEQEQQERNLSAANTIQRHYRGYRVRKQYSSELTAKMNAVKDQRLQQRIEEIEKTRAAQSEAAQKQEQMELARTQRDAEVKRLKEEQEKRKLEEEQKRKEEKIRAEEEKKRKEEEDKKRKEEEKLRKEEEKKQKEEEKRIKEEEERERKEMVRLKKEAEKKVKEEEQKRKEEFERQRREAEKQRKEAERLLKEEQKRKKQEEEEKLERAIKEEVRRKELEEAELTKNIAPVIRNLDNSEGKLDESSNLAQPGVKMAMHSLQGPVPSPPKNSDSRPQSARRNRQTTGPVRKSRMFLSGIHPPQAWGEYLPDALEKKRLDWIKSCTAWSKVLGELRTRRLPVNKKPPRRPISAKKLPLLDKSAILNVANVSSLQQVTTVELQDLPGCSLRTLAQCQHLKSLAMRHCHLVTTEGIEQCKLLEYVDLQHNKLEVVTCKDLSSLVYLDLSHNSLTTIHGLEGCDKLRLLNLSHNNITRIGGLEHLQSLHSLDLSHNQLITCTGLSTAATIQTLNLSCNHLTSVDDLDKLGLLQVLNVTGNTLSQVPSLCNHVLLQSVCVDDNNVTTLSRLCEAWVPMLHTLNLQQNGLTSFPDLTHLILLEELNMSNNQLLELESLLPGLVSVRRLQRLLVCGNPVTEEQDWRSVLEDQLPWLQEVDGVTLTSGQQTLARSRFERMCLGQIQQHMHLTEAYQHALSLAETIDAKCSVHIQYYTHSYNLATEHRYSHEYGEISANVSSTINVDFKIANLNVLSNALDHSKSKFDTSIGMNSSKPKHVDAAKVAPNLKSSSLKPGISELDVELDSMLTDFDQKSAARSRPSPHQLHSMKQESQTETVDMKSKFDALLSGAKTSKSNPSVQPRPVGTDHRQGEIQREKTSIAANAVGKILKQEGFHVYSAKEESAATKIQATWRGFILRKRLQNALSYARQQNLQQDDSDLEDYGEVDLNAFDFNEEDLEKDWLPPEVPQIPNSHAIIRHPAENTLLSKPPHPPPNPQNAWHGMVLPPTDYNQNHHDVGSGKPPLPPLSRLSDHTTDTLSDAHTYRSKASRKEEKISEEWGFKDNRTAELMLQRAKKLKYNAVKKKKLGQLDPKQRLALHKKLQETNKVKTVMPVRKHSERQEYFQGRELAERREEREKYVEQQNKEVRTFEWLHTQVGQHEVTSSRIQNRDAEHTIQPTVQGVSTKRVPVQLFTSEGNLPRMDPNVLAGRRALLTGIPLSMDLQSVESASVAGEVDRPRRMSLTRSDSGSERLPPIKTSSAPSARPEKMSWRNPEINKSVGWGGGKKHAPLRH